MQDNREQSTHIAKRANRAAICAALGVFAYPVSPLFALAGWLFGRAALKQIRATGAGQQHRAAAQFGVLCGWYNLLETAVSVFALMTAG